MNQNLNLDGKNLWGRFDAFLANYAQKNGNSNGRKYPEIADPNRLPFQRDRDRIIHTTSFRRLKGKMQVVSPALGDHYRNRLSHTLEVAQLARDLSRTLKLNEDLAEAIALAHDLGHPPFGHSGETMLDMKMRKFNKKFNHNAQSLRVVEHFERRYSDFPGLNLTQEVREGLQKHETFFDRPTGNNIYSPHLESQVVDLADEIAYLSADLEDGLRGGFFSLNDLQQIIIPAQAILDVQDPQDRSAIIRRIMAILFQQIVQDTVANLQKFKIEKMQDVQQCPARIVAFSPDFLVFFKQLKQFLFDNFYMAPPLREIVQNGQDVISNIFDFLLENPQEIPYKFLPNEPIEDRICDYIAGMTDEFALEFVDKIK